GTFLATLSGPVVALILAGGILYTVGVAFYLFERLPFHYTIRHGFVLTASLVFYAAVTLHLVQTACARPRRSHRRTAAFLQVGFAKPRRHRPGPAGPDRRSVDFHHGHDEGRGRGHEGLLGRLRLVEGEGPFLHHHLRLAGEAQDGRPGDPVQDVRRE